MAEPIIDGGPPQSLLLGEANLPFEAEKLEEQLRKLILPNVGDMILRCCRNEFGSTLIRLAA